MRLLKFSFIVVPYRSVCIGQWHVGPEGFKGGNVVITVIAIAFRFPDVISKSVRSREKQRRVRSEREGRSKRESLYLNAEIESARAHGIRDGITGLSAHMHSALAATPASPGPNAVP